MICFEKLGPIYRYIFGILIGLATRKSVRTSTLSVFRGPASNYGPGVEISPMLWVVGFHIEIKKEIFKNLLVPNRKG